MQNRRLLFPVHRLFLFSLMLVLGACGGSTGSTNSDYSLIINGVFPVLNGIDWPTYHYDNLRSGNIASGPENPQHLTVEWRLELDGAVYAEPLVANGQLIVATEHNSIYALDPRSGKLIWHVNLGAPVKLSTLPCGNINPLGITGTPVFDPATNQIFAVAEITGPSHVLVGINAQDGHVQFRRVIDPPGMTSPRNQQERGALTLANGRVYVAFGGLAGDCGQYLGWVVDLPTNGQGQLQTFHVPTGREGGIWTPSGLVVDGQGQLYAPVGNGDAVSGAWDESDSILHLSPDLQLVDGFAPSTWAAENAKDLDLGTMSPVLFPDGSMIADGKDGQAYLLQSQHLGGVGGEIASIPLCNAYGGAAIMGTTAIIPCADGLRSVSLVNGQLVPGWRAHSYITGAPIIGNHIIYSLDPLGTLFAIDPTTGTAIANVSILTTSRFATPTLYGNAIFVGTLSGIDGIAIS